MNHPKENVVKRLPQKIIVEAVVVVQNGIETEVEHLNKLEVGEIVIVIILIRHRQVPAKRRSLMIQNRSVRNLGINRSNKKQQKKNDKNNKNQKIVLHPSLTIS
eukprot:UN18822